MEHLPTKPLRQNMDLSPLEEEAFTDTTVIRHIIDPSLSFLIFMSETTIFLTMTALRLDM